MAPKPDHLVWFSNVPKFDFRCLVFQSLLYYKILSSFWQIIFADKQSGQSTSNLSIVIPWFSELALSRLRDCFLIVPQKTFSFLFQYPAQWCLSWLHVRSEEWTWFRHSKFISSSSPKNLIPNYFRAKSKLDFLLQIIIFFVD